VNCGTRIWIYTKKPHARIDATAVIQDLRESTPSRIWAEFGGSAGVTKADFDTCFSGATTACALVLTDVQPLVPGLHLSEIKTTVRAFQPPQFFRRLIAAAGVILHDSDDELRHGRLFQGL
jgi:predicted transcriptional regulator